MNVYLVLWPMASVAPPSYWPRFFVVTAICCVIGAGFELGCAWIQEQFRSWKFA
ncbi:MAG: hypothetical protein QNJ46_22485 [Leptolyngbyaceae cyanobacterium MO_188.B28]|nr:hypothetical protein [Leptolyngbyaceae cyanobacterium MO_188.B28]